MLTPEEIAKILGAPTGNTKRYWPLILTELQKQNANKLAFQIAICATVGVESGSFAPINEYGKDGYFKRMYEGRADLGNDQEGDGARFHGRGFVQITGRHNYLVYGNKIGVDLIKNPDLANNAKEAVSILVHYMLDHGIDVWAQREFRTDDDTTYPSEFCLRKIRKLVNGGYNHYDRFKLLYLRLKQAAFD